ncbi:hypothetical protein [Methanocella arvoryzae]|nr:hypothetical protein [Methanocella arvoryzae]
MSRTIKYARETGYLPCRKCRMPESAYALRLKRKKKEKLGDGRELRADTE